MHIPGIDEGCHAIDQRVSVVAVGSAGQVSGAWQPPSVHKIGAATWRRMSARSPAFMCDTQRYRARPRVSAAQGRTTVWRPSKRGGRREHDAAAVAPYGRDP